MSFSSGSSSSNKARSTSSPHLSVSAQFLVDFVAENGGRTKVGDMSTEDVRSFIVKIQTASQQESYVDRLVRQDKKHLVGEAGFFCVHAWKCRFIDLVDAVSLHMSQLGLDPSKEFVWVDLFSISQHSKEMRSEEWLRGTLTQVVARAKRVLVLLHPWDTAMSLSRAWCMFEILAAVQEKCQLDGIMPPAEHDRLLRELLQHPLRVCKLLTTVKAKYSLCARAEDKAAIHALMEQDHGGFSNVDTVVGMALFRWLVSYVKRQIQDKRQQDAELEAAEWMIVLGAIYSNGSGNASDSAADELLVRQACLEIYRRLLPEEDDRVFAAMTEVGLTYSKVGEHESARAVLEQCIALSSRSFGDDDVKTLQSQDRMASVLDVLGEADEAEELLTSTLAQMRRALGEDAPATLDTMQRLASFLMRLDKLPEAASLLTDCLSKRKRVNGEEHALTLAVMGLLAEVYQAEGKYELGLQMLRRTLGDEHLETVQCSALLAESLGKQGRYAEALPLFENCVTRYTKQLGAEADETLEATFALATTHDELGHYDTAMELYLGCRAKLAPDHPNALACVASLAVLYKTMGRFDEALPLQIESLRHMRASLGPTHLTTISMMASLALQYREQGRTEEALECYLACFQSRTQVLGADASETLASQHALAQLYLRDLGRFEEAAELFRDAVSKRKLLLGAEHPHTKNSRRGWMEAKKMMAKIVEPQRPKP